MPMAHNTKTPRPFARIDKSADVTSDHAAVDGDALDDDTEIVAIVEGVTTEH
jgi:hypothetical protein